MGKKIKIILAIILGLLFCFIVAAYVYVDFNRYKNETIEMKSRRTIDFTSNLPVVLIETHGKDISAEKIQGKIQVFDNGNLGNSLDSKARVDSKILIKLRGRSSLKFPKKQYGIEITNGSGKSKKLSLMGMPENSDWVLNGPYADKSLIRNFLVYSVAGKIMDYAPRVKFCEVFVKTSDKNTPISMDDYKGVYIMVEKIKRADQRVNTSKGMKNIDNTSYIVARDAAKPEDITLSTYTTKNMDYVHDMVLAYPTKDTITEGKKDFIEKDIDEIEKRMYSPLFEDPKHGYRDYIDVDSFVDFALINEFFGNIDAGNISAYFYKESGGKLKAGPVWDFNISMGNSDYGDTSIEGIKTMHSVWFEQLWQDPYFVGKAAKRYKELRKTYLSEEYLNRFIDKTVLILDGAIDRNFKVWGEVFNQYTWPNPENPRTTTHKEEIDKIKKYIKDRGKWMDSYFKDY